MAKTLPPPILFIPRRHFAFGLYMTDSSHQVSKPKTTSLIRGKLWVEPAPSPLSQRPDPPSGTLPLSRGLCVEGGIGSRVSVDVGGDPS